MDGKPIPLSDVKALEVLNEALGALVDDARDDITPEPVIKGFIKLAAAELYRAGFHPGSVTAALSETEGLTEVAAAELY